MTNNDFAAALCFATVVILGISAEAIHEACIDARNFLSRFWRKP